MTKIAVHYALSQDFEDYTHAAILDIDPENVGEELRTRHPKAIDISYTYVDPNTKKRNWCLSSICYAEGKKPLLYRNLEDDNRNWREL